MTKHLRAALLASTALGFLFVGSAQAADSTEEAIKALQAQVNALQAQLTALQAKEKEATSTPAKTAESTDAAKKEILPGVNIKVGGYIAMEGVYRDHNMVADMSSPLTATGSTFGYQNSRNYSQDEFRGSARATRLSLAMDGKVDKDFGLAAYVESDFMGQGSNSNSYQSNSYIPRLRQAFGRVDRNDWGFHFVGGQTYSLVTLEKTGMMPLAEAGPIGIDQYGAPGYVYTRGPQARFVKDLAENKLHVGLSLESPQATAATGSSSYFTTMTGSSPASSSMDYAPDVIGKLAYDSSIGHFEIFGLTRFFRDSVGTASYHNNYATGYGGGVGAFIPVIAKKLEIQANFLGGKGIGRYSSGQFPDFAFNSTGDIVPLTQYAAQFGIIGHPTPTWDLYLYAGAETVMRESMSGGATGTTTNYGYGNTSLNVAGCYVQGGTCTAQTQTIWQITPGLWDTVYKGDYGSVKVGAQYSFTRKDAFSGIGGQPHTYENIILTSFRYSPF